MAVDKALLGDDAGLPGGEGGEGGEEEERENKKPRPAPAMEDVEEAPGAGEDEEAAPEDAGDLEPPVAEPVGDEGDEEEEAEPVIEVEDAQTELFETGGPPVVPPKPAVEAKRPGAGAKKPAPAGPAAKPVKAKKKAKKKAAGKKAAARKPKKAGKAKK